MTNKSYIPVYLQCWFKSCQKQACKHATVNGTVRHLCEKHAKQYSNSAEKKDKN